MTTGSTVLGTVQGIAKGLGGAGDIGTIINVIGDPDAVVQTSIVNQIAWDGANGQAYQALAAGSTWVKIGSVA